MIRKKRYSVERIVAAVQHNETGISVAYITLKFGVAEQTFYRWKKEYGGLEPSQFRSLK